MLDRDPDLATAIAVADAKIHPRGHRMPLHAHARGQLLFVSGGGLQVETAEGLWFTPPGRACWVPGGTLHGATYAQEAQLRTVYVRPDLCAGLPVRCMVVNLSPLVRELVHRAVGIGWDYPDDGREARLMRVLVEEIADQPDARLFLPQGRDPRLRRVTDALGADPADDRPLAAWARLAGASERTLARLFPAETGLGFTAWRQQLRLLRAIELLADGCRVTEIAHGLGYGSASSFTTMFTRTMGVPPAAYLGRVKPAGARLS